MDHNTLNRQLAEGVLDIPEMFPHLHMLEDTPFIFDVSFGLDVLPLQPGILMVRGARQYGKSTWLEQQLYASIQEFGAGSAFYLNGDDIADATQLESAITSLLPHFAVTAVVKRIFIDEITAVPDWVTCLKRLADRGTLRDVLVITTGSKATDLRQGVERLPGRKGKLDRTSYLFTPISYHEFKNKCGDQIDGDPLITYLLTGGSPIACSEIVSKGFIPEYVIELVRDWVEGEITRSGRNRTSLLNIMTALFRYGGAPLGQAKLARESGMTNNTNAANYIELLFDLGCVATAYAWDPQKKITLLRKPCKYHITNLLFAVAYHPARMRSCKDFLNLSSEEQGMWLEWLVAQELQRRDAFDKIVLQPLKFWQSKQHEIDFVTSTEAYIEVKRSKCSSFEFDWFLKQMPHQKLQVINQNVFETQQVVGMTMEQFMLQD